jgi:hypothetical protein
LAKRFVYLMKIPLFILFIIGLSPLLAHGEEHIQLPVEKTLSTKNQHVIEWKQEIHYPNGDVFWLRKFHFSQTSGKYYTITYELQGKNGLFKYVEHRNGTTSWKTIPLKGVLPTYTGFVTTDKKSIILSIPNVYIPGQYDTILDCPGKVRPITVKQTANGYQLLIPFPEDKTITGEIWALESTERLIDWKQPDMEAIWKLLDFNQKQKWLSTGFYEKTPGTYRPTGANIYWRNPANYLARSFVITGRSRAADDLGWMMLSSSLSGQTSSGYWKTGPFSTWLWNDYRIGAGFYDSRFNTEMAHMMLKGYQKYRDPRFSEATYKYVKYLINHIDTQKIIVKEGKREGWLIPDYSFEGSHAKTHASLNHMLEEINYLYDLYLHSRYPKYKQYADNILEGIRITHKNWMKENGDLHYAYLPSGRMGLTDYPYLTYNDLVETQRLLTLINKKRDPVLEQLMVSKKQWMDRNNVTGYRTK